MCLACCVFWCFIDQNNRLQWPRTVMLLATEQALKCWTRAYFCEPCSMHNTAHVCCSNWKHADITHTPMEIQSWSHEKQYFSNPKQKTFYMWSIKKPYCVNGRHMPRRFFSMLFWLKQTVPQSKPNFPLYAKYVPHHPTDRCNYMMVDVPIRTWRPWIQSISHRTNANLLKLGFIKFRWSSEED